MFACSSEYKYLYSIIEVDFLFDEYSGCMNVFTNKYIKKGCELFDNYLLNKNIINHKEYLTNHYGFTCNC